MTFLPVSKPMRGLAFVGVALVAVQLILLPEPAFAESSSALDTVAMKPTRPARMRPTPTEPIVWATPVHDVDGWPICFI